MKEDKKMENQEKNVFLWGMLSFFVPIVGLVLYLAWKKEKPKTAKTSLTGAIIGAITLVVVTILCLLALVVAMYIFFLIVHI